MGSLGEKGDGQEKERNKPKSDDAAADTARAAAAALGVSALCVYALTASASVGGGDSGELLAEACIGGVAHPPGYGLWLELAAVAFAPDPTRAARRASLTSALCGAAAVWGCARAAAAWARHLGEGQHGAVAAVVAGGAFLTSPLPWEYATHAEVFALNNALVAFGIWCAAALAAHPRDRRPARFAALFVGCCAAHQHASLLTAPPLAAFAFVWLRPGPSLILELFVITVAAAAYPAYKLTERSTAATEGSWGDLTTARGLFTHLTRNEYGTFRLGASAPGAAGLLPRVLAYFTWSLDQVGAAVLALAIVGAGAGALSERRPARRAAGAIGGAWALYTLLWHGIWSNLPIHEPSMAYEVHARFWMQPHLLVCVMAGAGAAAVVARAPKPLAAVALALCVCVVASRVAVLWPALDFSAVAVLATHGAAALAAVPKGGLLLSHTDLHWNPTRYLRACEGARPDVTHLSLQLLPYPWFARQRPLYPRIQRWPDVAAASMDPATERYERLVEDFAMGNLDAFPAGIYLCIYLDLHGVHEPRIGRLGSWRGRWNLVPWGLHYRIVAASTVRGDAGEWLARSLAEIDRLRAAYEGGPPSPDRFRVGSWENAAGAAYNDAHYQTGLFALTLAQELRASGLAPEGVPAYVAALRAARLLTGPAADAAASHRARLSSPAGDAAKNALLAAVSLHGALATGRDLAARGLPFGNVDAPTDAELGNVTLDARRRAQRFLEVHGDDVDANVFRRFLAGS